MPSPSVAPVVPAASDVLPRWRRTPLLALAFVGGFAAIAACPRVSEHPGLLGAFGGTALVLLAWIAWLWTRRARLPNAFRTETPAVPLTHSVQPAVQLCIYAYWAWYWPQVVPQTPLFVAQALVLYALDALLSWTRGRTFRLGMGPLPIILSTNIFLWFKDDWFAWQFVLVALIVFGKEFLRWERDGRSRHVFNPSSFALAVVSLVLVTTGTTDLTWGPQIATTIHRPPHIYLEIFALGLIVQYLFGTVLMTLGAAIVLYVFNQAYTGATGVYYFIDSNIPVAVFVGMHLLVTDPATSPRTDLGKLLFGALYGAAICVTYWILFSTGAPLFYDKLLPIPIVNLSVRLIDRVMEGGALGRLTRWQAAIPRRRSNLAAMACWIALFGAMKGTGWIGGEQPGASVSFWRQAQQDGKRLAGEKLLTLVRTRAALGSDSALNALGVMSLEGDVLERDVRQAAHWFAEACAAGEEDGCLNVLKVFLFDRVARSDDDVQRAIGRLQARVAEDPAASAPAAVLLGLAAETGRGMAADPLQAVRYYAQAAEQGELEAAKGLARAVQVPQVTDAAFTLAASLLGPAGDAGDAEACLLLAFVYDLRPQLAPDVDAVRRLLQRACDLGNAKACAAVAQRFRDGR